MENTKYKAGDKVLIEHVISDIYPKSNRIELGGTFAVDEDKIVAPPKHFPREMEIYLNSRWEKRWGFCIVGESLLCGHSHDCLPTFWHKQFREIEPEAESEKELKELIEKGHKLVIELTDAIEKLKR